jgi:hypothetical protein
MVARILNKGVKGVLESVLVIVGAVAIGVGVPALWFWIGGRLGGQFTPGEYLSPQTFAAILPGMVLTYAIVLDLCGRLYQRWMSDADMRERSWPVRRASWNRSMRDERYRPGQEKISSLELIFVIATVGITIAFSVWFFLFAKSPI